MRCFLKWKKQQKNDQEIGFYYPIYLILCQDEEAQKNRKIRGGQRLPIRTRGEDAQGTAAHFRIDKATSPG